MKVEFLTMRRSSGHPQGLLEAEGNFSPYDDILDSTNGETGALMPVNSNQIYPTPSGDNFNLPALNFAQFLNRRPTASYAFSTGTLGEGLRNRIIQFHLREEGVRVLHATSRGAMFP